MFAKERIHLIQRHGAVTIEVYELDVLKRRVVAEHIHVERARDHIVAAMIRFARFQNRLSILSGEKSGAVNTSSLKRVSKN